MITYVDASSLLELVIDENGSERAGLIWDSADGVASVALVVVEGRAALAAAQRDGRLSKSQHRKARHEFAALVEGLTIIEVTEALRPSGSGARSRLGCARSGIQPVATHVARHLRCGVVPADPVFEHEWLAAIGAGAGARSVVTPARMAAPSPHRPE